METGRRSEEPEIRSSDPPPRDPHGEPALAHAKEGTMRKVWISILVVGGMAVAPWAVTHALFTGSAAVGGNAFTTGLVDVATSRTSAVVTFSPMAPAAKVTVPLPVS